MSQDLNKQRADLIKQINYVYLDPTLSPEKRKRIVEMLENLLKELKTLIAE